MIITMTNKVLELVTAAEDLITDLLEAHDDELTSCHYGDSDLAGEAPEACSYCKDIATMREAIEKARA